VQGLDEVRKRLATGSEHGPARSLPLGVMPYLERSRATKPPWIMPTEQMLVIRRATVRSARMPLDLVMPF